MNTLPEIHLTNVTTMTVDLPEGDEEGSILIVRLTEDASMTFIWDGTRWVQLSTPTR